MFFNQKFEYFSINLINPGNHDFEKYDPKSKEYKELLTSKEYLDMVLNELGSRGWELIFIQPDPFGDNDQKLIHRFTFKRSSWSKEYRIENGINFSAIEEISKERAKELQKPFFEVREHNK